MKRFGPGLSIRCLVARALAAVSQIAHLLAVRKYVSKTNHPLASNLNIPPRSVTTGCECANGELQEPCPVETPLSLSSLSPHPPQAGLTVGDMILAVNKDSLLGSNYDAAAQLLKETKGMVNLVVCNPNKAKQEESKGADGKLNAKGSTARSPTPTQPAVPEKPRLLDSQNVPLPSVPSRAEISKEDKALGLFVVGGSDTPLGVIIIHEIYPDGAVAKDGRLKVGDQLLEVGGPKDSVTHDFRSITHAKAIAALRQLPAKVKMIVYRDDAVEKEEDIFSLLEVELTKKSGKGLGLSLVARKDGKGVYISDLVQGGAAEADGRLMKGDQILSVNGQDLKAASQEEAAAVLKTALGKVAIKVGRLKTGKINELVKTSVPVAAPTTPSGTLPAPTMLLASNPDSHLISFPIEESSILVSPKRSSSFRRLMTRWSLRRRKQT
ncbi:hypothetical protein ONE63_010449 [Megalurothrips usitatus]|uniref:PDZ domain-containing protein n=1 Tax=Megalurothrips usitatus TaxID=439358 RepID=A0AAV7XG04_9NEOP|nr:hypothetical protein ONE63_010449 [Megalurothrips usitatus]